MTELEQRQAEAIQYLRQSIFRTVAAAAVAVIILTACFIYDLIGNQIAINDIKAQTEQIAELRLSRAADLAANAEQTCTYTKTFVAIFYAWADGLDTAEKDAARKDTATAVEKSWHDARIQTYTKLFKSLNALGTNACPKQVP